ncbi:MAG: hypothetical protein KDD55_00355 [Bdellovibrionales bacterium]|nr:hypothetical protein [Bdellovibrionales bacterium]
MRFSSGLLVATGLCFALALPQSVLATPKGIAIERASGPALTKASAHYARSRAMLIAALREFDKATQLVNPDTLIDSKEWRSIVYDRAEELQRILAPQPRASEGGVRFDPQPGLLGEAATTVPESSE